MSSKPWELFFYGSSAILAMKALDMTIGRVVGDRWYVYLIISFILIISARKSAEKISNTLNGV